MQTRFFEMQEFLEKQGSGLTISELHGFLIGANVVFNDFEMDKWLKTAKSILEIDLDKKLSIIIESFKLLQEREVKENLLITILVPEDQFSIKERFVALRNWTISFLLSFNLYNQKKLSKNQKETLDQLDKIAKTMLNEIQDNNENEQSYINILDFVQSAPLMLRN